MAKVPAPWVMITTMISNKGMGELASRMSRGKTPQTIPVLANTPTSNQNRRGAVIVRCTTLRSRT